MCNIYIIRHGGTGDEKSINGTSNPPLTDDGINKVLSETVPKISGVGRIISSPSDRALQTAQILAEDERIPSAFLIKSDDDAGTWNRGIEFTGHHYDKNLEDKLSQLVLRPNEIPTAGESLQMFLDRFLPFMRGQMGIYERDDTATPVAIITHSPGLRAVVGWCAAGFPDENYIDPNAFIDQEWSAGSILELALNGRIWKLSSPTKRIGSKVKHDGSQGIISSINFDGSYDLMFESGTVYHGVRDAVSCY